MKKCTLSISKENMEIENYEDLLQTNDNIVDIREELATNKGTLALLF